MSEQSESPYGDDLGRDVYQISWDEGVIDALARFSTAISPTAGGCLILAAGLQRVLPGSVVSVIYGHYEGQYGSLHAAVRFNGRLYDGLGSKTEEEFVAQYRDFGEVALLDFEQITEQEAEAIELWFDQETADQIAQIFSQRLSLSY